MIPEDYRRHIEIVQGLSVPGGALDSQGPHATVNNRDWFRENGVPRQGRRVLHERLKAEVLESHREAKYEKRALVLAGPPGAGKGRVAETVLGEHQRHYVNVDADEFKKLLLREALSDGSYDSWIKPHAVRDLEAQGERFYPLELASLVHEESSRLATIMRKDLIKSGCNVVVDTVLSSEGSAQRLGEQFEAAGYRVTVVDVEVPFEVSAERIVQRWQHAMQEAESGKADALGGRWVPSAYARPLFETEHGRSKSQDVAVRLAEDCSAVVRYERHYTSIEEHRASMRDGRAAKPHREEAKVRDKPGAELMSKRSATRLSAASFAGSKASTHGVGAQIQRSPRRPTPGIENGIQR